MDKPSTSDRERSRATAVNVGGELWLSIGEVAFLGEARIGLLEQIGERGSITQAAKAAGISYKAAWDAVDAMNNLAPTPVVATATGGRGGGGARLTDEGRRLIVAYRTISAEYRHFLEGVNAALGDREAGVAMLQRLALRTSARNQFIGQIVSVTARPVDAEVEIAIQGGARVRAGVTNESVDCLGLKPGRHVWALIKAVAVRIEPETPSASSRVGSHSSPSSSVGTSPNPSSSNGTRTSISVPNLNRLCGQVQRITRSDGPAEVVVALEAGITVRGLIDAERLEPLGIREQTRACALFEPASVIIGVSD
ncbi:TOBE domain-containing protein [Lamprobacter modestohalophilus]|uniref:TOBE domain-containing protein n=1 Tax=Lamprobacter modestohalophilus TaxID=1064514 RepID=UPI002ADEE423|nr:TOBE domain-containing protein [Lamprobacter modestohalophilus]MEA1049623.1 TOBE domain-containing protein [Lamprobacter modestohalophilus]